MHLTDSFTYPAGLETVRTMATNPRFVRSRLDVPHMKSLKVDVKNQGTNTVVATVLKLGTEALPDAVRRFVKKELDVVITETWSAIQDGKCQVTTDLTVAGAPVSGSATSELIDQGTATLRSIDADFHVKVAFIGKTIEQRVGAHVSLLWKKEVLAAQNWLADHPQG